jgi:pyruvate/2-oxoacid:ferredoxin oxidoreductase alpha subunit
MKKADIQILDGNNAAAQGAKLSRVQVIAAYPITPQSPVTEKLSELVEGGKLNAEYVTVESEHSALAVCTSASIVGRSLPPARTVWLTCMRCCIGLREHASL